VLSDSVHHLHACWPGAVSLLYLAQATSTTYVNPLDFPFPSKYDGLTPPHASAGYPVPSLAPSHRPSQRLVCQCLRQSHARAGTRRQSKLLRLGDAAQKVLRDMYDMYAVRDQCPAVISTPPQQTDRRTQLYGNRDTVPYRRRLLLFFTRRRPLPPGAASQSTHSSAPPAGTCPRPSCTPACTPARPPAAPSSPPSRQ